ncbi:MAG: hypothetical protein V7668_08010 [Cereibacter changlensis]
MSYFRSIFLGAVFCASPSWSEPDRLSLLIGSAHIDASRDYQQINPGVFATWEDRAGGLDYSLGIYRNSYDGVSVAGTAALPLFEVASAEVSLLAGAALYPGEGRSFRFHIGDVAAFVGLQIRRDPVFLQVIPGGGSDPAAIISFGITLPIGQ